MINSLLTAGLLFLLRVIDVSFSTIRLMMVFRGRRALAWGAAFLSSSFYIITVSQVLADADNWIKLLGYASGFATGVLIGMWLEERIAVGYVRFQVVSPGRGALISESLRKNGYAVTEISAHGKEGAVTLLHCSVPRRQAVAVQQVILGHDPDAFVIAQDLRPLQRGYWSS